LVALSRFGGVRVPSEALTLHWRDIDWSADRMTVHSPKTEHHVGKASRVVPIFGELRPYLEDVFDPDGDFVLPSLQREAAQRGDWRAVNLGTRFTKIVKRAGLTAFVAQLAGKSPNGIDGSVSRSRRLGMVGKFRTHRRRTLPASARFSLRESIKVGGAESGAVHSRTGSHCTA
jgi:integrase